MIAEVTDNDGERPEWLIYSLENKFASSSPLEIYVSYHQWRKINPKPEDTPAIRM
jgi:hypothetical protein